jgi:hypothetical protein
MDFQGRNLLFVRRTEGVKYFTAGGIDQCHNRAVCTMAGHNMAGYFVSSGLLPKSQKMTQNPVKNFFTLFTLSSYQYFYHCQDKGRTG